MLNLKNQEIPMCAIPKKAEKSLLMLGVKLLSAYLYHPIFSNVCSILSILSNRTQCQCMLFNSCRGGFILAVVCFQLGISRTAGKYLCTKPVHVDSAVVNGKSIPIRQERFDYTFTVTC